MVLGVILGVALAPVVLLAWLRFGQPPVAVADPPLPLERWMTHVPLHARIASEMVKTAPLQADEDNLVAGAQIYRDQCAACHGFHGKASSFAAYMYPKAPPLWEIHGKNGAVGVSGDPPGKTFWKVANGIRLSGMPAFNPVLTQTQIWQVSLLLANADKPLPPEALAIVRGEQALTAPQIAPAAKR